LRCYVGKPTSPQANLSVVVRPENVELIEMNGRPNGSLPQTNCVRGIVKKRVYLGEINELAVVVEDGKADIAVRVSPSRGIAVGQEVILHLPPKKTIVVQ
jgi:hypothetical protein